MQVDALLVATLLKQGRPLDHLSSLFSLAAVFIGLSPLLGTPPNLYGTVLCTLLLLVGLGEKYWALRVAVDAGLFLHLAQAEAPMDTHVAQLAQALQRLGWQTPEQIDRSWQSRCQSAIRLLHRQVMCLLLQVAITLAGSALLLSSVLMAKELPCTLH
ncbi:hypothetical protein QN096_03810 [Metapseudomonas otitidis]|uniref:hypothetical protein n=1 Tax=Metapseudomonas otitidis TaxID=319939 RepID=UPI00253F9FB4|nr:hypothetical protein [Pseudomonas otitidis]WIF68276.1 hypothetical protein QN096_03810 [Pseudomonas otitidis]